MAGQGALFRPEVGSLNHQPSEQLIRRAQQLERRNAVIPKLGGYLTRMAMRAESRAAKVALGIPAAAEMIVELPVILPVVAYAGVARQRFNRQAVVEYPHLQSHKNTYSLDLFPTTQLKGESERYAAAVLAYGQPQAISAEGGELPPGQAGQQLQLEIKAPETPARPNHLTPLTSS